jgi:hypothetical protein
VAALGAAGLMVLGGALMTLAHASPNADPILAESVARQSVHLDYPASEFTLTSSPAQTRKD